MLKTSTGALFLLCVLVLSPAAAVAQPAQISSPFVQTVAGPGFCSGPSKHNAASRQVGALAVDSQERVYFDTGLAAEGALAKVDIDGRAKKLLSSFPSGSKSSSGASWPAAGRLAPDGEGGVFIAAGARIERVDAASSTSTLAGDPLIKAGPYGKGPSGDGKSAAAARFGSARSLATDEFGNLYVADEVNRRSHRFRIRVINRSAAPINFYAEGPSRLTFLPGHIDTIVGRPTSLRRPGQDPALGATLRGVPPALAVRGSRLYISAFLPSAESAGPKAQLWLVNLGNEAISAHGVKVQPGHIRSIATGPKGGQPKALSFSYVPGLSADPSGNLFLADERRRRILKLDSVGRLSIVAGGQAGGGEKQDPGVDDLPASRAVLDRPYDVKVSPNGNLYISDRRLNRARYVEPSGTIRAVPGIGVADSSLCLSKSGRTPRLKRSKELPQPVAPSSVAVDSNDDLYFPTPGSGHVRKLDKSGLVTIVAGTGGGAKPCSEATRCKPAGDGGLATKAKFVAPVAIALGPKRALYIFDVGDARVRLANVGSDSIKAHGVQIAPGQIETIAGNGKPGVQGDGGKAVRASLGGMAGGQYPEAASLAVEKGGRLLLVDRANQRVREVDARGTITTVAGEGGPESLRDCCRRPLSVALDRAGNLYVGDGGGDASGVSQPRIWFINRGPKPVVRAGKAVAPGAAAPAAGNGSAGYSGNGVPATESSLGTPVSMAVGRDGSLYIGGHGWFETDEVGNYIGFASDVRRVDPVGIIHLLAGNGQAGFNGDGLRGPLTSFSTLSGIALDSCGDLLLADSKNDRLRRLKLVPECPLGPYIPGY